MHLEETYTGIMRVASNRDGKTYKDWREYYVDQSGLIMIFQSDSKPGKYAVYFFLLSDEYMHSSCGKLQIQDGKIRIETERSIYEFEEDQKCLTMAEGLIALDNAKLYFGNPDCMCICQKTMRLQKQLGADMKNRLYIR